MKKIYEKIEKLHNMVEDNCNENEVKVAKKKLYELMNKHNISKVHKKDEIIMLRLNSGRTRRNNTETTLRVCCSRFCGCEILFGGRGYFSLYGKINNIEDAQYLFNQMYEKTYIVATDWYKKHKKEKNLAPRHKSTFRLAMAQRIKNRLSEITKGHIKYNGEKGLIVLNDSTTNLSNANDYINKNIKNVTSLQIRTVNHSEECRQAGIKAGNKVKLNKRLK